MTVASLIDSCGPGIWSLDIGLQSCPLKSDASLATVGFMECISYLFSQGYCVPSQPAPRERTPGDCVSKPLAWPGCSVLTEGWGGLTVALWVFGLTGWLCSVCLDSVTVRWLWKHKVQHLNIFERLAMFFLWSFFHWLFDLCDICSIPYVLLIIIFSVSAVLYYDNNSL